MSFENLGLVPGLLRAVAEKGYDTPTAIQLRAIPAMLTGGDVLASAQTGTGKTASFVLPLLQKLEAPRGRAPRALVLTPTRELAAQVGECAREYGRHTGLRIQVIFGGVGMQPQIDGLKSGCDLLVATPGRLLDLEEQGVLDLDHVAAFVLDEADRMLDIGFLPDLQRILSYLPKNRTTLLFSATFSPEIKRLAGSYLQNPVTIEVARPNETASTVEQRFYSAHDDDKRGIIRHIVRERGIRQAFVFVNSKLGCARLTRSLERDGLRATALHGDKSQDERLKALEAFKAGEVDLLVCTDVAARGLDIKDVPAVFNFDVPFNAEDYVHRIGRTGRAGASGLAVTLVGASDTRLVADIEKLIKKKIEVESVAVADERPRERFSENRRPRREDSEPAARPARFGYRAPALARDPFFDRPYEPSTAQSSAQPAAWEVAPKVAPVRGSLSANIKPKRKLAALFKAPTAPAAVVPVAPETCAS